MNRYFLSQYSVYFCTTGTLYRLISCQYGKVLNWIILMKCTNKFNVIYPSLSAVDKWNTRGRYCMPRVSRLWPSTKSLSILPHNAIHPETGREMLHDHSRPCGKMCKKSILSSSSSFSEFTMSDTWWRTVFNSNRLSTST